MAQVNSNARQIFTRTIRGEHGQYAVWFLLLLPLVLVLIGLVVDGGVMYGAYRRAQIAVDTAAQAAAHEVDAAHFAATNEVVLAPGAMDVAILYAGLNAGGSVRVTQVAVTPDGRVRVVARGSLPTVFMRAVGIERVEVRVAGHARPAFGLNEQGQ